MSNTVLYEGYSIRSFPKYLEEWEKWQFRIVISFKQHGAMQSREFSSDILYITEHDADIHGRGVAGSGAWFGSATRD
jgi:hypothetical protein